MGMAPSNFVALPLLLPISLLLLFSSYGAARDTTLSTLSSSSYSTTSPSPKSDINAAIVKIKNCGPEIKKLAKFIHKLQKKYKDGFDATVLSDCKELIPYSKDELKYSINALKEYENDRKAMHVADVQSSLSAAGTDVSTCYYEIQEFCSEGLKDAFGKKMTEDVEKLIDVALDQVNNLHA